MAAKTISLELDAYEKLRKAKRFERESFSQVVRRARWDDAAAGRPGSPDPFEPRASLPCRNPRAGVEPGR